MAYLFGNCEVRVATRELLVDGQLKTVQPRVFDLLAYLLQQRHRAVAKQELVNHVWRGAELSESVLARTVMLVRRLVGDNADQPVWVQNVYGFGYRFIGPVVEHMPVPASGLSVPTLEEGFERPHRIGLFPIQNQTNNASLAWTQSGLMSLVGHALERDRRLVTTAIGSDFLQQLPAGTSIGAAARQACELFGLELAVYAVLRSQADTLWMDYQVFGDKEGSGVGSLRDDDPVSMGERLSKAISALVLNGVNSSGGLPSGDAFVNQVFGRAMECASTQDWKTTAALLGAAVALEPDNLKIELECVRCAVLLKDPAGLDRAMALLARLQPSQDLRLLSGCHDLIAQALNLSGDLAAFPTAADHRQKALDLAARSGPVDWAVSMRINAGNIYMEQGNYQLGREHLNRALTDARLTGNLSGVARSQQNLAIADRLEGNLFQAKQRMEESLQIWRRMPRRPLRGHVLMHLAQVNFHLGLFEEAGLQCDESLTCFNLDQLQTYDGASVAGVSLVYLLLGRVDDVDRLAARFVQAFKHESPKPIPLQVAMGCAAIGAGFFKAAREHLLAVILHDGIWPGVSYRLRCAHALLHMELAIGDEAELETCRDAFKSLKHATEFPEWKAGVCYVDAALHLLRSERSKALSVLMSLALELPLTMSSQMARLDAAWLLLEEGDTVAATALMGGAPTWRDGHPAGLALRARLQASLGCFEEARQLQILALESHCPWPHPFQAELVTVYQECDLATKPDSAADIPTLPRLLCSTFVAMQREVRLSGR